MTGVRLWQSQQRMPDLYATQEEVVSEAQGRADLDHIAHVVLLYTDWEDRRLRRSLWLKTGDWLHQLIGNKYWYVTESLRWNKFDLKYWAWEAELWQTEQRDDMTEMGIERKGVKGHVDGSAERK